MKAAIAALSLMLFMVLFSGAVFGQEHGEHHLVLKVGDKPFEYHYDQLKAMATKFHISSRGTKKNPAVALDVLLTKDTKVPLERIIGVVIVGEERVLFLEGDDLKHIKNLKLALNTLHLVLVPDTDEAYKALRPIIGPPRLPGIERIDVYERRR